MLKDEPIVLKGHYARRDYSGALRRVTARVKVDGEERVMVFLTNNVRRYGTADGDYRRLESPRQAALPGFAAFLMGQHA